MELAVLGALNRLENPQGKTAIFDFNGKTWQNHSFESMSLMVLSAIEVVLRVL